MIHRKDAAKEFIKILDREYAWYFIEHEQIYIVDSYDNTLMKRDAKFWGNIVYLGLV